MSKVKETFVVIICAIINIIIAFSITTLLGISNIVLFRTYTAMSGDITWDVIIFLTLSLIEAIIYEIYKKKAWTII